MSAKTNSHLRLLGTVWADESASNLLGYVVIDTREQLPRIQTLTTHQMYHLLMTAPFENARLENGEVYSTECSLDRLPKYNQRGKAFANEGYMVVARITDNNGDTRGFRLVTSRGEILNVAYETLMNQVETNSIFLINAKVSSRNNTPFVSAIRGEFKELNLGGRNKDAEHTPQGPTNTPEAHANYLNKLISKVATAFITRGDYPLNSPKTKDYKIFYKEFLKPKYPELAQYARKDIGWTQVIAILLLIAEGVKIPPFSNGVVHHDSVLDPYRKIYVVKRLRTKDKVKRTDTYYKQIRIGRVPEDLLTLVKQYDATGDVYRTLTLYNRVYDGKLPDGTPVREIGNNRANIIGNSTLNSFVKRLINDTNSSIYRKKVDFFVYDTAELDYFSDEGYEKLGLTLNPARDGARVESPLFKPITQSHRGTVGGALVHYVFNDSNLTEAQVLELFSLGQCYGDFNIFRLIQELLDRRSFKALDHKKVEFLLNFYMYVLAVHNKPFAKATALYLGITHSVLFDIDEVSQRTNRSDLLLYHSGLRFGTKAQLVRGESFSGSKTNYVPNYTKQGFNDLMYSLGHEHRIDKKAIPRFSNVFSYWG